jgi:predicted amidohydrolase
MCNSIGYSDNFVANGLSSIWNKKGELLEQLDEDNQGLLIYDIETEKIITAYNNVYKT